MRDTSKGNRDKRRSIDRDGVILPYCQLNGQWSVRDDDLHRLWHRMEREATRKSVFAMGEATSADTFVAYLKSPYNIPAFYVEDDIVILGWLNGIECNHAYVHFWMARDIWGRGLAPAQKLIRYWFDFVRDDGTPTFDVLLGKTPAKNKRAVAFVKRCGWEIVGTIPKVWAGEDLTISYIDRDVFNGRKIPGHS